MDAVRVLIQIPPAKIALLCSLFEGYEGVAAVRTAEMASGLVVLLVAPAFLATALELLRVFAPEIGLPLCDLAAASPRRQTVACRVDKQARSLL